MTLTVESYPGEYGRPPVFGRPPAHSMVKAVERVLQGQTQTDAMKEVPNG